MKKKPKTNKGKKYEKPVSLYGMTLTEAVDRLVPVKPAPKVKQKRKKV